MPIATPAITLNVASDHIGITFANSDTPSANFLRRNGVYISKTIANDGTFLDYQTRNGEQVFYVGSAYDGTQESAPTAPKTAIVSLSLATIHKVTKGATSNVAANGGPIELSNPAGQRQVRGREGNRLRLAAQEKPRFKTSPLTGRYIECPIFILREDWGSVLPDFEAMIQSNDLFCYRDQTNELMFFTFPDQEAKFTQFRYSMNMMMVESAYSEAIA
jgi:hypothetical protein